MRKFLAVLFLATVAIAFLSDDADARHRRKARGHRGCQSCASAKTPAPATKALEKPAKR